MATLADLLRVEAVVAQEAEAKGKEADALLAKKEKLQSLATSNDLLHHLLSGHEEWINHAENVIATLPTEAQVLKLERRVETLKDQVECLEKTLSQHNTGIDAYSNRRQSNLNGHKSVLNEIQNVVVEFETILLDNGEDGDVKGVGEMIQCHSQLQAMENAREDSVVATCHDLEEWSVKKKELTDRVAFALRLPKEAIPKIELEKETDNDEIAAEWNKEFSLLQGIYEKLFTVNKEQQFHLQRGTHIKRQSAPDLALSEKVLSAQHAKYASEIIQGTRRNGEVQDDVSLLKRQIDVLRKKGQAAQEEFNTERSKRELHLVNAQKQLDEVNDESNNLRNLKGELNQALQSTRETQPTPRIRGKV